MSPKSLAILAAVAVVISVAAFLANRDRQTAGAPADRGPLIAGLTDRANDVARIEVTRGDERALLERGEGGWVCPELHRYPADAQKVRDAVLELAELEILEPRTRLPESYARLGVQDPGTPDAEGEFSTLLVLRDAAGAEITSVILGKPVYERAGTRCNVRRSGEDQAWLVDGAVAAATDEIGWVDTTVLRLDSTRVRSARIEHADGEVLEVSKEAPAQPNYTVAKLPQDRFLQHEAVGNPVATPLAFLSLDDLRPAGQLVGVPLATEIYTTYGGLRVVVDTYRLPAEEGPEETWITVLAEAPAAPGLDEEVGPTSPNDLIAAADQEALRAEAAAINERLGPWAYRVPSYKGDVLLRRMDDLVAEPTADGTPTPTPGLPGLPGQPPPDALEEAIQKMLEEQDAAAGDG